MTLLASEIPTARYLDEPGQYIMLVVDYFRRDSRTGVPQLHCRMEVLRSWTPEGWTSDRLGQKVTRPLPLRGPRVAFLGDLLRATGNEDLELDPDDDSAIARAICLQPFVATCKHSKLVPSRSRPGEMIRFMNVVQIASLDRTCVFAMNGWAVPEPDDWAALCVPDPNPKFRGDNDPGHDTDWPCPHHRAPEFGCEPCADILGAKR